MSTSVLASIQHGLSALYSDNDSLNHDDHQAQQLAKYVALLDRWNRKYNLTAVRDPADMVAAHLLDSLSILPFVSGPLVMDVGTGAGLPGIPLSLFTPDIQWILVDSNGKKTRFVVQAISELGLTNVTVRHARIEEVTDVAPNQIVTRAYAPVSDMVRSVSHLMQEETRLLAMKATNEEASTLQESSFELKATHELTVPGLSANRCLLEIGKRREVGTT